MPTHYKEKKECWQSFKVLKDSEFTRNSIVVGDFNVILSNKEKRGGSIVRDPFKESMEYIIEDGNLVDVKPIKRKYT